MTNLLWTLCILYPMSVFIYLPAVSYFDHFFNSYFWTKISEHGYLKYFSDFWATVFIAIVAQLWPLIMVIDGCHKFRQRNLAFLDEQQNKRLTLSDQHQKWREVGPPMEWMQETNTIDTQKEPIYERWK